MGREPKRWLASPIYVSTIVRPASNTALRTEKEIVSFKSSATAVTIGLSVRCC